MWWISCCWNAEEDDRRSVLTEECYTPEKLSTLMVLPTLEEPLVTAPEESMLEDPLDLVRLPSLPLVRSRSHDQRPTKDEFIAEDFCEAENISIVTPRRCVSSEMGGIAKSIRLPRSASIHPLEDGRNDANASPMTKQKPLRRIPYVPQSLDRSGAISPDAQNVGYSSWFALLSRSIGSEVSGTSSTWLIGPQATSRQIEGA